MLCMLSCHATTGAFTKHGFPEGDFRNTLPRFQAGAFEKVGACLQLTHHNSVQCCMCLINLLSVHHGTGGQATW